MLLETHAVDEHHRVWRGAVDQPQRDGRVGRVVERPLPLDEDPVATSLALLDERLRCALEEVRDHAVDGDAPALDHHAGLAGRHERRPQAGLGRRAPELERHGHLSDRAVRPNGQDHARSRPVPSPDGRLHPLGRPAVVDDPDARVPRGSRQLGVVAQERVEAAVDVEAAADRRQDRRPPRCGQPAAGRGDSDQQRGRGLGQGERVIEGGDDRDVPVRQPLRDVPPGERRVEDRNDRVRAVPDHTHRGLAVMEPELAFGQDREAALGRGGHRCASLGKEERPRARGPGALRPSSSA